MRTAKRRDGEFGRQAAFTLKDCLVLGACVALLFIVQLSALGNGKGKSRLSICFANFQQLTMGWQMYAEDFNDRLVPNPDGYDAGQGSSKPTWVGGWMDFTTRTDNTNTELLVSYGTPAGRRGGLLGNYIKKDPKVFRCPEDSSSITVSGRVLPRVRSVSMNTYMGGVSASGRRNAWVDPGFRAFSKASDIILPKPSKALVFMDEREDSINDPNFAIDLAKDIDFSNRLTPASFRIVDYPADWHEQGGVLSFADGHAEHWKWQDSRTYPEHVPNTLLRLNVDSPGNVDVGRIAVSMSARR